MTRVVFLIIALTTAYLGPVFAQNVAQPTPLSVPFYDGIADEASLTRRVESHLERGRELLKRLLDVAGRRTPENTLRVYDDLRTQVLNARGPLVIVRGLHPDSRMRTAAELLARRVDSFEGEISLHRGVFAALAAIDAAGAPPDVRYYLGREIAKYRREGIDRDEATRDRLRQLREELRAAQLEFGRNIREGVRRFQVEGVAELEGLPADYIAAHPPDTNGRITLTTNPSDADPVMAYARSENLRRRMHTERGNVAFPANATVLRRMLGLRYQIARTLGYRDWASYEFEGEMAGHPSTVTDFLDRIVRASAPTIRRDYDATLARKRLDHPGATSFEAWEGPYYAELVRRASYDFDTREIRPYLPYERVRDGLLDVTSTLFGFKYVRVTDVSVWHPSVQVYEVFEEERRAGRIYLDTHPRPGKVLGEAGLTVGVRRGVHGVQLPELVLVAQLPGGQPGDPGLMTPAGITTFFHEFGHVVQGLAGRDREWIVPRVEQDFVEVPSLLLEEWTHPSVIATFARHYQTDEPVPAALLQRMRRAVEFTRGIRVRNEALRARFALSLHSGDPTGVEPGEVYRDLMNLHLPPPKAPAKDVPLFSSVLILERPEIAGYYGYLWGEVIRKDLFSQFDESNLLDPAVARRFKETVLAPSGSRPSAELVQNFLGRPFDVAAWEKWLNGQPR